MTHLCIRKFLNRLQSTKDPILRGRVPNPEPESTETEVWVKGGLRFKLRRDVAWPWEKCKP